jgi:virginiamycin B lyase
LENLMARTDLRWRRCARAFVSCALAGVLALFLSLAVAPARASGIRAYKVVRGHSGGRVYDVAQASNHVMWFTRTNGHHATIGRLDARGKVDATVVPWRVGGSPPMLARGQGGSMWFTAGARLGRIDSRGNITSFPLPNPSAVADDLAVGSDGAVWFIERVPSETVIDNSRQYTNVVGRMDVSGVVAEYPVGTTSLEAGYPSTIVPGLDGTMWFTEGTAKSVGRVDLQGHVTNFPLRGFCSGACLPGSITAANGAVWFATCSLGASVD